MVGIRSVVITNQCVDAEHDRDRWLECVIQALNVNVDIHPLSDHQAVDEEMHDDCFSVESQ